MTSARGPDSTSADEPSIVESNRTCETSLAELVIDLKTAKALAAGRGGSRLFVEPRRLSLPLLS